MKTNTCEIVVGRLVEITVDAGYHAPDDVEAMIAMIGARFSSLPPRSLAVIAADWRGVHLMNPETAARAHAMFTRRNPLIERSAVLVSGSSGTEMLQFVRLVREAAHPGRKIFDGVAPMRTWLNEVLTPAESARLGAFLSRPAP